MLTQSLIADARGESVDTLRLVEAILADHKPLHPAWGPHRQMLGWLLCSCEQFDAASSQLFEVLPSALENHWPADLLFTIAAFARILAHRAELVRAVELLGLVFTHPNSPQGYLEQHQGMTRLRADLEAQLGTQAYRAAWEQGIQLDVEQTARHLLREFSPDTIDPIMQANQALFDPLTPRELEILNLLAVGLTNTVISNRLFITPGTVKGHVNKILHKLDAETRQQAVMRARELGLLKA
jgi:DNA-binding CsgD family transcriptional regulator